MSDITVGTCYGDSGKECSAGQWTSLKPIQIDINHDYGRSAWYINASSSSNVELLVKIIGGEPPLTIGSTGLYEMVPSEDWKKHSYISESETLNGWPVVPREAQPLLGANLDANDSGGVWVDDLSFWDLTLVAEEPE